MKFKSKGELLLKLRSFNSIGEGAQGICYLDINNKLVYKIYHDFLDDYKCNYNYLDIMRFSNIKNNTYIFPKDVIYVKDEIVGYIEPYVNNKDLTKINPLKVSLKEYQKVEF